MAVYRITDPNTGRKIKITGDSPPTESELNDIFSSVPEREKPSLLKRGYDALTIPEKLARGGIEKLTDLQSKIQGIVAKETGLPIQEEPTGSLARDVMAGTPRVLGETAKEVLPGFVSRGSILTAGALKGAQALRPIASIARKGVLSTLEKTSGISPRQAGALEAAYKDPTLMFASGKSAAGKYYEAAKQTAKKITENIKPDKAPKIMEKALEKANSGILTPIEALKGRKAVDKLMESKSYIKDDLIPIRQTFDAIAKTDPNIKIGDELVARGVKASAIRQILPTNVGGTFSSFRTGIGGGAAMLIPGGKVIAPIALSPVVQGAGATAAGALAKVSTPLIKAPIKTTAAVEAVKQTVKKPVKKEVKEEKPKEENEEQKVLTKPKAYEFLKQAKGNKKRARRLAKNAGYTWEGDF